MSVTSFYVASSSDDYTYNVEPNTYSYNDAYIRCSSLNFGTLSNSYAGFDIDTGALSGETVTAATFNFYVYSFGVTKGMTLDARLYIESSLTVFNYVATLNVTQAGWKSITITSGMLQHIKLSGDTRLQLRTTVVGSGQYRIMDIRSYDYGSLYAYLSVTHETAAVTTAQIIN